MHAVTELFDEAAGLLLVLLLVGLPALSLLCDLCHRDLQRSKALAEAALRRALEDPRTDPRSAPTGLMPGTSGAP